MAATKNGDKISIERGVVSKGQGRRARVLKKQETTQNWRHNWPDSEPRPGQQLQLFPSVSHGPWSFKFLAPAPN